MNKIYRILLSIGCMPLIACALPAGTTGDDDLTALLMLQQLQSINNQTSAWVQYTMNIGATTTAPSKATNPDIDIAMWRRSGDSMEITYTLKQSNTTGATAGTGTYLFPIPSGNTIDLTKIASGTDAASPLGIAGPAGVGNTTGQRDALVRVYDSNNLLIVYDNNANFVDVGSAAFELNNANTPLYWSFRAVVPILGWSVQ